MAWIRVPIGESIENPTLFGYGINTSGQRFSFRLNGSNGSNSPDTPQQAVRLEVQNGSIVGNTFVDDGNWHHIAIVCDDFDNNGTLNVNETRIYVDGVLDTDPSGSIAPRSSSGRAINTSETSSLTISEVDCLEQVTFETELNSPPDDKQFSRIRADLVP